MKLVFAAGLPLLLAGCQENELKAIRVDAIAVSLGDFDDVQNSLTAMDIASVPYDGFIVQATYDPSDDRLHRGEMALQVESLLTDPGRGAGLEEFNAIFVNSGTRGLNRVQYNDATVADDALLLDAEHLQATCDFVVGGGTLVASDWAYDLVEFCWPERLDFFGEDTEVDAGQVGIADDGVIATVSGGAAYTDKLGSSLTLAYNYSAWSVIESAGGDTEVLLRGDVPYQPSAAELEDTLLDVPLLVRFVEGRGQVIFSTFHWGVQNPQVTQTLLLLAVEGLNPGDGSESQEVDSGA